MQRQLSPADKLNPVRTHAYLDVVRVWLLRPLTTAEFTWLRPHGGGAKLRVHNRPARFNRRYCQRLTLFQPTTDALQSLATRDHHLTYAEISLDWIFSCKPHKNEAVDCLWQHLVKNNHRDQGVIFVGNEGTQSRYSGPRNAPNVIVVYSDKPSRVTGQNHCVHLDWRVAGGAALRRNGIHSLRDLLDFNFREFWERRLRICSLDLRSLGRMHCNRNNSVKRRGPWIQFDRNGTFAYDFHLRTGSIIVRASGSTQAVIDRYRKYFEVNRCVITHNVRHLLPREDGRSP